MSRPRPLAYRSLAVHRPAPAPAQPRPLRRASVGFLQALRGRGDAQAPDDAAPAAVDHAPHAHRDTGADADGGDHDPGRDDSRDHTRDDDAGADWAQSLVPTGDSLASILARAPRHAAAALPGPVEAVARTIAGFCNEGAVSHSEGWSVRIALRPDVLPDTTLELSISTHWLQLNFAIGDPSSRELLRRHRDALAERLAEALVRRREIAITIEEAA